MRVHQISVFLENKEGRLAQVTGILADAGINMRALSLADTADFGVLRMIVDDTEKAENALKDNNITVGKTNVVAVKVEDSPGGLHKILEVLKSSGINVEYMYAIVQRIDNCAVMVFRFDDTDKALEALQSGAIEVLSGEQVYSL